MNTLPSVSELMVGIHVPYQQASPFLHINSYGFSGRNYQRWPRIHESLYLDTNKASLLSEPGLPANKNQRKSVEINEISSSESQQSIRSPNTPREHRFTLAPEVTSLSPGHIQNKFGHIVAIPPTGGSSNSQSFAETGAVFKSRSIPENLDRSYGVAPFNVNQHNLHAANPPRAALVFNTESKYASGPKPESRIAPISPCEASADPLQRSSFSHYPSTANPIDSRVCPYLAKPVMWAPASDPYSSVINTAPNSNTIITSQYGSPPIQFGYSTGQHDEQLYAGMIPVGMALQPVLMNLLRRAHADVAPTNFESHQTSARQNKRRTIKRRTRTGCLTCRKRRIKCDERKPHCFNCERSRKVCLGYERLQGSDSYLPKKSEPVPQDL